MRLQGENFHCIPHPGEVLVIQNFPENKPQQLLRETGRMNSKLEFKKSGQLDSWCNQDNLNPCNIACVTKGSRPCKTYSVLFAILHRNSFRPNSVVLQIETYVSYNWNRDNKIIKYRFQGTFYCPKSSKKCVCTFNVHFLLAVNYDKMWVQTHLSHN